MELGKYSLGVGDRFARQAEAQLRACVMAAERGVDIVPVWNKSFREHTIVGSAPESVRLAADAAVSALEWRKPYHVDADHIGAGTLDAFIASSDFFTIDVAEFIGRPAEGPAEAFIARHPELSRAQAIEDLPEPIHTSRDDLIAMAAKYGAAVQEAGRIYMRIADVKHPDAFITEVSMDETDSPQSPIELLIILAMLADAGVPVQTIAPKFTGRFNKGVDYVGDVDRFQIEFESDLAVIAHAVRHYELPRNLKLSIHSGSDKFSLYTRIGRALARAGAGVHLKTAGTTWLEELIGLAESGGDGLEIAVEIYAAAFEKRDALCAPYAAVIDIDAAALPAPSQVAAWSSDRFVSALRHNPACPEFNPSLRQLLHVGYKIAAQMGDRYLRMLDAHERNIARNVTHNLFARHIEPLFLTAAAGA